jgi:hypothetical protein
MDILKKAPDSDTVILNNYNLPNNPLTILTSLSIKYADALATLHNSSSETYTKKIIGLVQKNDNNGSNSNSLDSGTVTTNDNVLKETLDNIVSSLFNPQLDGNARKILVQCFLEISNRPSIETLSAIIRQAAVNDLLATAKHLDRTDYKIVLDPLSEKYSTTLASISDKSPDSYTKSIISDVLRHLSNNDSLNNEAVSVTNSALKQTLDDLVTSLFANTQLTSNRNMIIALFRDMSTSNENLISTLSETMMNAAVNALNSTLTEMNGPQNNEN